MEENGTLREALRELERKVACKEKYFSELLEESKSFFEQYFQLLFEKREEEIKVFHKALLEKCKEQGIPTEGSGGILNLRDQLIVCDACLRYQLEKLVAQRVELEELFYVW